MPFGLTNALAYFVDLMSCVFRNVLNKFMVEFVDDILVFSMSIEEVLRRPRILQLKAKFLKYHFWHKEACFLRHIQGLHMES